MNGGSGADVLIGGFGNDVLTGGRGADIFRFEGRTNADRITDFTQTSDLIEIGHLAVSDFAGLRLRDDAAGNAIVSWGDATGINSITIVGVRAGSLTSDDFAFI
jgi:Ca2+-binding RTX toxin-like protein